MSREAVNRVLELAPSRGLSHLEFRVLVYLADRQNAKTGQLNPSPERIARDCGLDPDGAERSIRRAVDRLEAKGLVERIGSGTGGRESGGRYPKQHYRLHLQPDAREDMTSTLAGHGVHPKGGHGVPQNQGSRSEPGNSEPPNGSTIRVEQARPRTQQQHPRSRMIPFLPDVLAYDEDATWIEGKGIRLESGKILSTVPAVRKFLAHCGNGEPGEW